ncbi:MAG: cyclophilin family peptidyl-prolyl cis-trans isomerase [Alteromonas macleodii]|jgi:cyclophilin family peptidyl-prolyl cis-trans isomerase
MLKCAFFATVLVGAASADGIVIDVAGDATGTVYIDLFEDFAPLHAAQITTLASDGSYDGVVFHRVIDGFMAQTGDVEYGDTSDMQFDMRRAGTGSSELNDIVLEATTELSFTRGMVGMARSQNPNSANSQFFIMFDDGAFLDGQYTIVGEVVAGMDVVDAIKLGDGPNGAVTGDADMMDVVRVIKTNELADIVKLMQDSAVLE